jgi:hypothetical protein
VPSPGSSGISPLVLLLGGGVIAMLLALLLRRRAAPSLGGDDPSVRVAEDGFWLGRGLPIGSRVKYACVVRGVPVSDTVTIDGGAQGTFVYTGGAPVAVRIVEVTTVRVDAPRVVGGGASYRGASPRPPPGRASARPTSSDPPPPIPPPPQDPSPPFGGFPPAY